MCEDSSITPVILCGGEGSRLWPLSSQIKPKQFISLPGRHHTFLQDTLMRIKEANCFNPPILVIQKSFITYVEEQLKQINMDVASIIMEPHLNGTAFASSLAAFFINKKNNSTVDNELLLIMPIDHYIKDATKLFNDIRAIASNSKDHITIFGVTAKKKESNYGYIQVKENPRFIKKQKIIKFIEKPKIEEIDELSDEKFYYWNSGIVLSGVSNFLNELKKFSIEIYNEAQDATDNFNEMDKKIYIFPKILSQKTSVDEVILENSDNVFMCFADIEWYDIGSLQSAWEISEKDSMGNFSNGNTFLMDTLNSYVISNHKPIAVIGLKDVLVVNTNEAILVACKSDNINIKKMYYHYNANYSDSVSEFFYQENFSEIKEEAQDYLFPKNEGDSNSNINDVELSRNLSKKKFHKPWGYFYDIQRKKNFAIKKLNISPFQRTSLQLHKNRSEYLVVIDGSASITVDCENYILERGDDIYIPCNTIHRIANNGKDDLFIIEVQSGDIISENDIVRINDDYGR